MGRIRTIKPELLEDEKTAQLSDGDWRLFVSSILLADDYGNFRSEPGLIRGQAMWGTVHDERGIDAGLVRLEEVGLLASYCVRGQRYLHIVGWSKHQKIDKPGKPHVPGPDDPEKTEVREWRTYFIRLGADGPIKIGKAVDVKARIAKLQTSAPAPLILIREVTANVEAECHRRFQHLRTHGEWFAPDQELLDFIATERFANQSRIILPRLAPDLDQDPDQEEGPGPGLSLLPPRSDPDSDARALSDFGSAGVALLAPHRRPPIARVGAVTPAFLSVFDPYPRQDGKQPAAQAFQEIAETYPGGEAALAAAILAAYGRGFLKRHPYAGPNPTRPMFDKVLAERRWEDPASAPDNEPARVQASARREL